ncbi:hypothetical protein ENC19_09380 [Verrucosispora sp. CWR15]|uniref:Uncharacterized protein n=1 Tax=Verrucosispora sioxanthis TaxID=2499994 RepID=A0A6M1KYY4_9ACTN|nr:hypothetical protein [Verrucosispora sioxanthis]NEE63742.1 hypothetical protein [Verrucosispora sioxanthis]NGM12852.1 hypothetical protein [Verrucosispora sioxanthis]
MTGPPPRRADRRSRLFSVLLAAGGVVGAGISAVLGNITGNLVSEWSLTVLGSASLALAALGVAASFLVEWRRRQREHLLAAAGRGAVGRQRTDVALAGRVHRSAGQAEAVVAMLALEHAVAVVGGVPVRPGARSRRRT